MAPVDPIITLANEKTPDQLLDDLLNSLGAIALVYQVKPGTVLRLFTPALLESDDAWPELAVDQERQLTLEKVLSERESQ